MSDLEQKKRKSKISDEKLTLITDIITYKGKINIEELSEATKIPVSTLYRYINHLINNNLIEKNNKEYNIVEKKEEDSLNSTLLLNFLLPKLIYNLRVRETRSKSLRRAKKNDTSDVSEESTNNNDEDSKEFFSFTDKTILLEFTDRGYEQVIANALWDKYLKEVSLITIGVGGIIIHLKKKYDNTKIYKYLEKLCQKN